MPRQHEQHETHKHKDEAAQPVMEPQLTEGERVPTSTALTTGAQAGGHTGTSKAIDKRFRPMTSMFGGLGGDADKFLGKDVLEIGAVWWQLSGFHHGVIGTYKTLAEAQKACILHVHTKQPGTLASIKNPSTWEIIPVIRLTVSDITAQPAPVGSLAKSIDDGTED